MESCDVLVSPGEDNNIYCKFCYHRKFAPVGYRQYTYPDLIIITPLLLSGTIFSESLFTGIIFYFRGAGCADWVDGESNNVLRHSFQAFNILLASIACELN